MFRISTWHPRRRRDTRAPRGAQRTRISTSHRLKNAFPPQDGPRRLAPDLADWAGLQLFGAGRGCDGAGWGGASSDEEEDDDDASDASDVDEAAGDDMAARFDAFCATRDGRRLVRELGPERALRQWRQKGERARVLAKTNEAVAAARRKGAAGAAVARRAGERAADAARTGADAASRAVAEARDSPRGKAVASKGCCVS